MGLLIVQLTQLKIKVIRSLRKLLMLCLVTSLNTLPTSGFGQSVDIHSLKAVFLFNFSSFIQWPTSSFSSASQAMTFCTIGNPRVKKRLQSVIKGETIRGRQIKLIALYNTSEMQNCHIIFIGASEEQDYHSTFKSLAEKNILTVGESPEFLSLGGMIYLKRKHKHLQIEVNMKSLKQSQLKISSKLLRIVIIK